MPNRQYVRVSMIATFIAITAFLMMSCGPDGVLGGGDAYSRVNSDSGIKFPTYDDILSGMDTAAAGSNGFAKVIRYGKSVRGRDLAVIRFSDPRIPSLPGRPAVYISEATHGNEYLHVADQLVNAFAAPQSPDKGLAKFLSRGGVLYMIPVFNPDGFSSRSRENSNGKDLNRDYPFKKIERAGFTQTETKAAYDYLVKDLADSQAKLQVTLDYHCCVGAVLYPYGYKYGAGVTGAVLERQLRLANRFKTVQNYEVGPSAETVGYTATGTSDDFYLETYDGISLTHEAVEGNEYKKLDEHLKIWDETFTDIANTASPSAPPGGSADLVAKIIGEPAPGQLAFAVASSPTSMVAEICMGAMDQCRAGAAYRLPINYMGDANGRRFFRAASLVPVSSGASLTLLARDTGGNIIAATPIRLGGRLLQFIR